MSVPSGCVFATGSPQRVALADVVRQQPPGNVLLDPRLHQPTPQPHVKVTSPAPIAASGSQLHCQHCFIAERLS